MEPFPFTTITTTAIFIGTIIIATTIADKGAFMAALVIVLIAKRALRIRQEKGGWR